MMPGIVGQVIQTGEPRRVSGAHDAQADRPRRRSPNRLSHRNDSLRAARFAEWHAARRVRSAQQARAARSRRRISASLWNWPPTPPWRWKTRKQFSELSSDTRKWCDQAAQDTLHRRRKPADSSARATVRRIADTDLAVLLLGENGTGKEVVARAIHFGSRRRKHPFIAVNCAALTETLLESELFGHEKGAFTDAHEARAGKFELASGGTLFLDEIGDMSLSGQAKLLRVLEEKTIVRVGGSKSIHTDVRVLAATNQKLAELVRARRFREDLYFRLNVVTLELPPLRDRGDDIMLLAEHFLREFSRRAGRRAAEVHGRRSQAARKPHLAGQRSRAAKSDGAAGVPVVRRPYRAEDLAFILSPAAGTPSIIDAGLSLNDATQHFQENYIKQTIERARGNVSQAAKNLGVHRSNLYRKMRQLGMETEEENDQ